MRLVDRWQQLAPRERILVVVALVLAGSAAVFEGAVMPLIQARARLSQTLPELRALDIALSARIEAARALQKSREARRLPWSEVSLREALAEARLTPQSLRMDKQVAELVFADVEPSEVLGFVSQTPDSLGVRLHHFQVIWPAEADQQKDRPRVRITLAP
jgi:type II secretory pathway component PulM